MASIGKIILQFLILLSMALILVSQSYATTAPTNETVLASAKEKGKAVANYLLNSSGLKPTSPEYFDVCSYYGYCLYFESIGDGASVKTIYDRYKQGMPSQIKTDNIDNNAAGILPLHLYLFKKDEALLKLGKNAADYNISKDGWVRNAIDDTYMTGSLMVQAYRATKDMKYLNFAAKFISGYMNNLQQSSGLFWHMPDSKNFWGRGNGWGAASTTELLQELPDTNENYSAVMEGYKKQMAGLLAVQKSSGMWKQLIDTEATNNWEESSGTAMFLFAIFTGLKNRWLDEATYLEPAKKGWMALAGYVQNGKLGNVAAGFWPKSKTASEYLNAAKGQPGDSHGTAAILWAATAAIKYLSSTGVKFEPAFQTMSTLRSKTPELNGKLITYDLLGRQIFTGHPNNPYSCGAAIVIMPFFQAEKRVLIPR